MLNPIEHVELEGLRCAIASVKAMVCAILFSAAAFPALVYAIGGGREATIVLAAWQLAAAAWWMAKLHRLVVRRKYLEGFEP